MCSKTEATSAVPSRLGRSVDTVEATPQPEPRRLAHARPNPRPVLMPAFSIMPGRRPDPQWRPSCTHVTMTRLYCKHLVCDLCRQPPAWGWLYRCTQDREHILALESACETTAAGFADQLAGQLRCLLETTGRCIEAAIETASGQYTLEQLATVFQQRQNVKAIVSSELSAGISSRSGAGPEPWAWPFGEECQMRVCHCCRMSFGDRAYLSLDGVLNDEVPPTATTDYSFHLVGGERPIIKAGVARHLGLRAVPLRHLTTPSVREDPPTPAAWSMMELFDDQIDAAPATSVSESDASCSSQY